VKDTEVPAEEVVYFTLFSDASVYTPRASFFAHLAAEPLSAMEADIFCDTFSSTSGSEGVQLKLMHAIAARAAKNSFLFMIIDVIVCDYVLFPRIPICLQAISFR
jgi:hypothetical protein